MGVDDEVKDRFYGIFELEFAELNGLHGGELELGVAGALDANGCPVSFNAIALGEVDVLIDSIEVELLVPRTLISTKGGSIGTVEISL